MNKKIFVLVIALILLALGGVVFFYKNKEEKEKEFKLDSKNKYLVVTDYRWTTMMNDGGSYTSIYYQIDLDKKIVVKVSEVNNGNLDGVSKVDTNIEYTKKLDKELVDETKNVLDAVITTEDKNDSKNYEFFTIKSLNINMDIYNKDTISSIKELLSKYDNIEK